MENLDKQLEEESSLIREYLLHQLDETAAEEIDERITTDPEFFEMVLLIEQELLEDVAAGRLSGKEMACAEALYASGTKGGEGLAFNKVLHKIAETNRRNEKTTGAKEPSSQPVRWSFSEFFRQYRFALAAGVFLFIIGISFFIWYLQLNSRSGVERELARLNRDAAAVSMRPNVVLREITLQARSNRDASTPMPRVQISGSSELISFKINVPESTSDAYTATFLDEKGAELFTISDLKPQGIEPGAFISILVPAKFLPAGDFQICLQGQFPEGGEFSNAGSYAFRIAKE